MTTKRRLLSDVEGKRLLVLGGTGRVGKALYPFLVSSKPSSFVLTGQADDLNDEDLKSANYIKLELPEGIARIDPKRYDVVLVLAADSDPRTCNQDAGQAIRVNVETVTRLMDRFRDREARIVVASSIRTSGAQGTYTATKIAVELSVSTFPRQDHGPTVTVVRLGNVLAGSRVFQSLIDALEDPASPTKATIGLGTDYFEPTSMIPWHFDKALRCEHADIITPLLPEVPIGFLAGVLVSIVRPPSDWNLPLAKATDRLPLLPEAWYPFSRADTQRLDTEGSSPEDEAVFLVTNFRGKNDEKQREEIARIIEKQQHAELGRFPEWIREELSGLGH
jgi:hypothetical protein